MTSDGKASIRRDLIPGPPRRDQYTPSPRLPDRQPRTAQRSHPNPSPVDPRKWYLDENTGEYLRITYDGGSRIIVDPTPYGERWKRRVLAEQLHLRLAGITFGFFAGGLVLWAIAANTQNPNYIIPGLVAIFCFLTTLGLICALLVGLVTEGFSDLGPEPVPQRPRREQAEQQQVHGAGRFMNRDEIHRAASGGTAFPTEARLYED
jgi:hypothetical protein